MTESLEQRKILSIDAGGTRGLSSLLILEKIMHQVRFKLKSDLEPYQYFDLIGGTGTGGIIALMLGRLRMSVIECIGEYYALSASVFGNYQAFKHEEIFKAKDLENAMKGIIERKLGKAGIDAPLLDPLGGEACKTIVLTIPKSHPNRVEPTKPRTYESRFEKGDCTIWQAAMATSATPPFFPPMILALSTPIPVQYIDAGIGFNNPSSVLLTEAWRIWGDSHAEVDFNRRIGCFLSLGTGFLKVARLDDKSFKKWMEKKQIPPTVAEVIISIATDTEKIHEGMQRLFDDKSQIYHRFNVEQGLQEMQLFEHEKSEELVVDTDAYLDKRENQVKITSCIEQLSMLHVEEPTSGQQAEEFA